MRFDDVACASGELDVAFAGVAPVVRRGREPDEGRGKLEASLGHVLEAEADCDAIVHRRFPLTGGLHLEELDRLRTGLRLVVESDGDLTTSRRDLSSSDHS